jgi:TnpA family transposase
MTTTKRGAAISNRMSPHDQTRGGPDDAIHMIASLKAGTVAPSVVLEKLAAYRRQNRLDLVLQVLQV